MSFIGSSTGQKFFFLSCCNKRLFSFFCIFYETISFRNKTSVEPKKVIHFFPLYIHTRTLCHTHTLTLSNRHYLSLALSLTHTYTPYLSSHTLFMHSTSLHTLFLSLSITHTLYLSHTLSNTHNCTLLWHMRFYFAFYFFLNRKISLGVTVILRRQRWSWKS